MRVGRNGWMQVGRDGVWQNSVSNTVQSLE